MQNAMQFQPILCRNWTYFILFEEYLALPTKRCGNMLHVDNIINLTVLFYSVVLQTGCVIMM